MTGEGKTGVQYDWHHPAAVYDYPEFDLLIDLWANLVAWKVHDNSGPIREFVRIFECNSIYADETIKNWYDTAVIAVSQGYTLKQFTRTVYCKGIHFWFCRN
jgi:hypothetical protein